MTTSIMEALGLALPDSDNFEFRVVTATVVHSTPDVAVLRTSDIAGSEVVEGIMPVTEWYPGRRWERGVTYQLLQIAGGARPMFSAVRPELVSALLAGVSPEIRSGAVRVMGVARQPGVRTKVAVAATETDVDPIASCVGKGAARVKYLTNALEGERIDIVAWNPDRSIYLANALAPARVSRIELGEDDEAVAFAPAHLMSASVGAGGLNSQLAGELVGLTVTIAAE